MIRQGDIFWADLAEPLGSGPGFRRPVVVLQNDVFNRSRLGTVIVCALTTNLWLAKVPGNVLLDPGEAGLPRQSAVNVSQLVTLDKRLLLENIGTVAPARVREILQGVLKLLQPCLADL